MEESFAGPGETSSGPRVVTGHHILEGTHTGAVVITEGGHLEIRGTIRGPLSTLCGGRCTISGTVYGPVVANAPGDILTNDGAIINGISGGTIGFGSLNGPTID